MVYNYRTCSNVHISNSDLEDAGNCILGLTGLSFDMWTADSRGISSFVTSYGAGLKTLEIVFDTIVHNSVSVDAMAAIGNGCPNLQHLHIKPRFPVDTTSNWFSEWRTLGQFDDKSVIELLTKCAVLETLKFEGCLELSEAVADHLAANRDKVPKLQYYAQHLNKVTSRPTLKQRKIVFRRLEGVFNGPLSK